MIDPTPPRVREIVPLLFVDDMAACVSFYVDILGFELQRKWEPDGNLAWCRLGRDGASLMLQKACDEDGPPDARGRGIGFYFNCDNIDALYAEFASRGLQAAPPKPAYYGEKQLTLRDPAGYNITFQSPVEPV
jgi:uncharacterized glyoxalase superfamily protein PhnB